MARSKKSGTFANLKNDLMCLKTMWFSKARGATHKDRLESFYEPQAEACALIS